MGADRFTLVKVTGFQIEDTNRLVINPAPVATDPLDQPINDAMIRDLDGQRSNLRGPLEVPIPGRSAAF